MHLLVESTNVNKDLYVKHVMEFDSVRGHSGLLATPQVRRSKLGKCRDKKETPCGYHLPIMIWSNPVVIFWFGASYSI